MILDSPQTIHLDQPEWRKTMNKKKKKRKLLIPEEEAQNKNVRVSIVHILFSTENGN